MPIHDVQTILLVDVLLHLHIVHLKVVALMLDSGGLVPKVAEFTEHQLLLALHFFSHLVDGDVVVGAGLLILRLEVGLLLLRRALVWARLLKSSLRADLGQTGIQPTLPV